MKTKHSFDLGEYVTIFQMSPSKGLFIEGVASIVELVADVDEQYVVRFRSEPGETYERFVDAAGQDDPAAYVREFNDRIGIKPKSVIKETAEQRMAYAERLCGL